MRYATNLSSFGKLEYRVSKSNPFDISEKQTTSITLVLQPSCPFLPQIVFVFPGLIPLVAQSTEFSFDLTVSALFTNVPNLSHSIRDCTIVESPQQYTGNSSSCNVEITVVIISVNNNAPLSCSLARGIFASYGFTRFLP